LIERLRKFNLEIAEEKTKSIEFGRFAEKRRNNQGDGKPKTFDFIGFTHYCSKSKNGKFRVKRKTSRKKFKVKLKSFAKWLYQNMHTESITADLYTHVLEETKKAAALQVRKTNKNKASHRRKV